MKTFEEFLAERSSSDHHNTPHEHQQIDNHHKWLKTLDKDRLVKELGSRLDMSHAKKNPKSDLINAALHAKFASKKVEAWGAKRIKCPNYILSNQACGVGNPSCQKSKT